MDEKKKYIKEISTELEHSEHSANVTNLQSVEKKAYIRSYAMPNGRKREFLEKRKSKEEAMDIMFPPRRLMSPEEAAEDPERIEKAKTFMICVAIALICLLMYPLVNFAMSRLVIEQVRIEGSDKYTADELLEACGFVMGDKLPLLSAKDDADDIGEYLPYIESCEISFELPNTIVFTLSQEDAVVYTEIFGEFYALSDDLKVLERSDDESTFADLPYIKMPATDLAVAGKDIILSQGDADYIVEFLAALKNSKLDSRVSVIYFESKFDIVFSVDEKYRVLFGSPNELTLKFATINKMIEENTAECTSYGIIDVRVVEVAGIVINADINPLMRE